MPWIRKATERSNGCGLLGTVIILRSSPRSNSPCALSLPAAPDFSDASLPPRCLLAAVLTDARGKERAIERITLVDVAAAPPDPDARVHAIAGDLGDPACVDAALAGGADSVFHLAAVVSGEAETNFDLGWRVNVDATRLLLERCRMLSAPPKFVFTSSCAVFGGPLPDPVPDDQALWPQSSYGNEKAACEFLVYDFTRKGFIDGRSLRLPTISVRPGKPNKAASSFASGILREPLNGIEAICPVEPRDADVAAVTASRDREHDRRSRRAGGGVRAYAQHQRARHVDSGRRHDRRAAPRGRRRSRQSRGLAARSGDRSHRADMAGELRYRLRPLTRHDGRRRFRWHHPPVHRRRIAPARRSSSESTGRHAATATGSTAASASRNSSGPASRSFAASDSICR